MKKKVEGGKAGNEKFREKKKNMNGGNDEEDERRTGAITFIQWTIENESKVYVRCLE